MSTYTMLCEAEGNISADVATRMRDPMTGGTAALPAYSVVSNVAVYRDGNVAVSSGCDIVFGTASSPNKYIHTGTLNTNDLNTGHAAVVNVVQDRGHAADDFVVTFGSNFSVGSIIFEVTYVCTH